MNPSLELSYDKFASECLGISVYNLKIPENFKDDALSENLRKILSTDENFIVICKHNLNDWKTLWTLASWNFYLTSVDVTFKLSLSSVSFLSSRENSTKNVKIVEYSPECSDLLQQLLKNVTRFFTYTHYYNSPFFSKEKCDVFYKKWIQNCVSGRCNRNYIAICNDKIVGFIFGIEKKDECIIDLIWVDKNFRGQGIGKSLIFKLLRDTNAKVSYVGTQLQNVPAVNLYTSCGYRLMKTTAVYHKLVKGEEC